MARRRKKLEDRIVEAIIMAFFYAAYYLIKAALMMLPVVIRLLVDLLTELLSLFGRAIITAASSVHWHRIGGKLRMPSIISILSDNFFAFLTSLYLIGGLCDYLNATPNVVSATYLSISVYIIKLYSDRQTVDFILNGGDPEAERAIYDVSAPNFESKSCPRISEKQSSIDQVNYEHSNYDPRNDLAGDWPNMWEGQPKTSMAIQEAIVSGKYAVGSGIDITNNTAKTSIDIVPDGPDDLIECSPQKNRLGRALSISRSLAESYSFQQLNSKNINYKYKNNVGKKTTDGRIDTGNLPPNSPTIVNKRKSRTQNLKSTSASDKKKIGVQLDLSAIRSLEEESQKVSEILNQIFSGDKEAASKYQADASPLPSRSQVSANEIGKEPIAVEVSDITMEGIRLALRDRKISLIAESTGLSRQSLYKIMDGTTPTPRLDTYLKLVTYLQGSSSQEAIGRFLPDGAPAPNSLKIETNDIGRESIASGGPDITMEEIRLALKDRKISVVAKATGLSRQSLYNIIDGTTPTLRIDTYQKLVKYLCGNINSGNEITTHPDGTFFSSEEQPQQEQALVWGLNKEISSFARLMITKDLWRRDELETLAAEHTLMLDGVLEEINEAAFDMFDEALIEGADPYEVNKNLAEKIS